MLAFVGQSCVGSGPIGTFRADLAQAGLGDGHCGFRFDVSLTDSADRARVYVKLQGSDLVLPQQGVLVTDIPVAPTPSPPGTERYEPETIAWMRDQGWLRQTDFDFLRHINAHGVYARTLRSAGAAWIDPADEARRLFALYRQGPVRLQESAIRLPNLGAERQRLIAGAAIPLLAIHAEAGVVLMRPDASNEPPRAPARHACTADRLLLIDARRGLAGHGDGSAHIFRAAPRAGEAA